MVGEVGAGGEERVDRVGHTGVNTLAMAMVVPLVSAQVKVSVQGVTSHLTSCNYWTLTLN